jgi:hypothetical protein
MTAIKKYAVLYLIIFIVITSCTSIIQVTVPDGKTQLVIDAFLDNAARPQTVRITNSSNYFSNVPCPAVLGATVSLNDLNNAKTYTFTPDGKGNYIYTPVVGDTMGFVNHKYQLNVSYNGNIYIALSILYPTIPVDTIIFRRTRTDIGGTSPVSDTTKPRKYYPLLIARDIKGQTNYYWIKAYKNSVFYNQPSQMNFFEDSGGAFSVDGGFIQPPNDFFGLIDNDNPYYRNDTCLLEIYSINPNTNSFLGQLQTQMTNSQNGLFAVTPQNVKTNIQQTSGNLPPLGWFNMAAVTSKKAVAE